MNHLFMDHLWIIYRSFMDHLWIYGSFMDQYTNLKQNDPKKRFPFPIASLGSRSVRRGTKHGPSAQGGGIALGGHVQNGRVPGDSMGNLWDFLDKFDDWMGKIHENERYLPM